MPSLRSRIAGWLLGVDSETAERVVDMDSTSPRVLKRRLDNLDEQVDYLAGQIARLRGRVVGGVRKPKTDDDYVVIGEGDPEPDPAEFEELDLTPVPLEAENGRGSRPDRAQVPGMPEAL